MCTHRIAVVLVVMLSGTSCRLLLDADQFEDSHDGSTPMIDASMMIDASIADAPVADAPPPDASPSDASPPDAFVPPSPIEIGAGLDHTCALFDNGEIWCWGGDGNGQLGNGGAGGQTTPQLVTGVTDAIGIAVGRVHTCALHADKTVSCWGFNATGQLGNGTFTTAQLPVPALTSNVVQVTSFEDFTCARLMDDSAHCWGINASGQLGIGNVTTTNSPTAVMLQGVAINDISTGRFHTCATATNTGQVHCWGSNQQYQLGNSTVTTQSTVPVLAESSGVADLWVGTLHSCALPGDGTVQCWGSNGYDQLGRNTNAIPSYMAVEIVGLSGVTSGDGTDHNCVVAAQAVKCWGRNTYGQLGPNGTGMPQIRTPVTVSVGGTVTRVATGSSHSCAIRSDGTVWCWGSNTFGKLGNGDTMNSETPVQAVFPAP